MEIRDERPGDEDAIHALTAEAFRPMPYSSGTEPAIIRALRASGALTLSLVAVEDGCRAIDTNDSLAAAIAQMDAAGVRRILSHQL